MHSRVCACRAGYMLGSASLSSNCMTYCIRLLRNVLSRTMHLAKRFRTVIRSSQYTERGCLHRLQTL